jgi:hypothetical protein
MSTDPKNKVDRSIYSGPNIPSAFASQSYQRLEQRQRQPGRSKKLVLLIAALLLVALIWVVI